MSEQKGVPPGTDTTEVAPNPAGIVQPDPPEGGPFEAEVRVRYRGEDVSAVIEPTADGSEARVEFRTPERAIAAKTGLLGLASAFAARQLTARFFIAGFANASQRGAWLPRIAAGEVCAAVAISEPLGWSRPVANAAYATT